MTNSFLNSLLPVGVRIKILNGMQDVSCEDSRVLIAFSGQVAVDPGGEVNHALIRFIETFG
jgi:hypothetical protein